MAGQCVEADDEATWWDGMGDKRLTLAVALAVAVVVCVVDTETYP